MDQNLLAMLLLVQQFNHFSDKPCFVERFISKNVPKNLKKALLRTDRMRLDGTTPQGKGICVEEFTIRDVCLKFEAKPEGKQINILRIQVLCGV